MCDRHQCRSSDKRTRKRRKGDNGEESVIEYMTEKGYRLVCRNFSVHNVGEIDCVFEKDNEIYVTEVRSRRNDGPYPSSCESVDYNKQRKILRCTKYLVARYGLYDRNITFLIGQVTHSAAGMVQNVEIIPF